MMEALQSALHPPPFGGASASRGSSGPPAKTSSVQTCTPSGQGSAPAVLSGAPSGQGSTPAVNSGAPSAQGGSPRSQGTAPARGAFHKRGRRVDKPMPENGANESCKVHVTGFPAYTQAQDLAREFAQFGTFDLDRFTNKFACLTFATSDAARAAIGASRTVNLYGQFLTVRYFTPKVASELKQSQNNKKNFPRSKEKGGVIVEPSKLDLSGDFSQQLERVLAGVRLTQEAVAAIGALYADVERVLQALWPGSIAMPFGSITTGLGIQTSDADCYVHVPQQYQHNNAHFVGKAKRVLQLYPNLFAEILSIPRANTPIVKFFHVPTETNCDLSFKTPLGAQNSKLIAFLLHADPRLLPMAVVIKYWAKVHGLSGTGRLTNYALTMMIIFYLQQPPISILPSVEFLQRDRANDIIVDFWNTGFMSQRSSMPLTSNTSSISELLGGFFEYYSVFNFDEMVVCPFLGTPILKEAFRDLNKLPRSYDRYKYNVLNNYVMPMRFTTSMCVQDPFEQCHNVASAVTSNLASDIMAFLKFAASAYENDKPNNCENFLKTILLEKPKIVRVRSHPEYRVSLFPKLLAEIVNPNWKSVVREIISRIFEKILKLKLGKVDEKVNTALKKDKERYAAILTKAIWKRKQLSKLYINMHLDFQRKQQRITEEIMAADKNTLNVHFQLVVTYAREQKSAVVLIKLMSGEIDAFREFGKFFSSVMQSWFTIILKSNRRPVDLGLVKVPETANAQDEKLNPDLDSDDESVAHSASIDTAPDDTSALDTAVDNVESPQE